MKDNTNIFIKFFLNIFRKDVSNGKTGRLDKLLYIIPLVILAGVMVFVIISQIFSAAQSAEVSDELYNKYSNENKFKERVYGEDQTPNMENTETPETEPFAISVYGDSYCISADVHTPSFAAYLSKYTNLGLVYNVAAPRDTLEMVAARVGGVPMYISPCDIPAKKKNVEITLENEYGTNIVPDFSKNAGLNPCKVNGVEGVISLKEDTLYFSRNESGYEAIISTPAAVQTKAMDMRLNDVSIFFLGNDEMYGNSARTVEIYRKIVSKLNTDKYLIVGPVSGSKKEIEEGNKILAEAFGNKFFNLYDYLSKEAVEEYALQINGYDPDNVENERKLPDIYFSSNKDYFNDQANNIIGKKIADVIKGLNYIS